MMRLELTRQFAHSRFPEIGVPYRVFRDSGNQFLAVCSYFPLLGWSGRTAYDGQAIVNRICLYSQASMRLLSHLDIRSGVNDLSFHPTEPIIALATGGYDGGYMFEGSLTIWHWDIRQHHSVFLESRDVVRCRFEEAGGITALLHPRNEEEYEDVDAFETYIGVTLPDFGPPDNLQVVNDYFDPRLVDLGPADPSQFGFEWPDQTQRMSDQDVRMLVDLGFEQRGSVGDILSLDSERFALCHTACHLEIWSALHGREAAFSGDGHGVELIPRSSGECLVHVHHHDRRRAFSEERSELFRYSHGKLAPFLSLKHSGSFSADSSGRILARDTGDHSRQRPRRTDHLFSPDGSEIFSRDLGHYDTFNHCLRLNGGRELYYLRGTPADQHLHKVLCAIDQDGRSKEVMPWDMPEGHLMSPVAVFVQGTHLVRGCQVYNPAGSRRAGLLECLSLQGRSLWKLPLEGCFTCLAALDFSGLVAFALTDGRLGVVEIGDGRLFYCEPVSIDGVPTIVTALCSHGEGLLAGTIDGRVLLYRITYS